MQDTKTGHKAIVKLRRSALRAQLKRRTEQLSGERVWIETATDPSELRAFLKLTHPVTTKTPLIRVGGASDGGYLLPDDLEGITTLVSPGVSNEISFDLALAERGVNVFMADASVAGPPVSNPKFHFEEKFVDVFDDDRHMRFDTLCDKAFEVPDADALLQMDIEGAEYHVLLDAAPATLRRFRIMAIEFHDLTSLFGKPAFELMRATFMKLLQTHHIVHIHPNNNAPAITRNRITIPPVMEFTFYRKDRADIVTSSPTNYPHALDVENIRGKPPLVLPACWHKSLD